MWDIAGIPFRFVLFDQAWLPRFGWTTLEAERIEAVLPHIRGRLLDIGAGANNLVKRYGSGTGVDVHDWGGGATVVEDTSQLPFDDGSFDTVAILAALNHIPNRADVLREARRVLNNESGRLIVTMIPPLLGNIGHRVWWYDEHRRRGGMKPGETGGMTKQEVTELCAEAGFHAERHEKFLLGLNNLYIFETI
jgi:SAM-dependent methyltransferase